MYRAIFGIFANQATREVLINTAYTLGATAIASTTYTATQIANEKIHKEYSLFNNYMKQTSQEESHQQQTMNTNW